jgi:pimeloyl-ACP methyl ester carboxylesterase
MTVQTEAIGEFQVRVWSAGDGPPLLYLHGFEGHPGDAPFLRRLAERHRVYAPETPGYGASTGFECIDGILGLTLYHRQLVESWGVGAIDVIGHSLGGMFAAEFAAICPQLTRRLVLVDAYGLWLDEVGMPDPFVLSEKELKAAKWANPDGAAEPSIFVPAPDAPQAAAIERARNLGTATKFLWPIPDRGLRRRLGYISAPTLVIHGASDGLIPPAYADEFARLIPNARVATIDGAGHLPMVEQEDAFIRVVEDFLSG